MTFLQLFEGRMRLMHAQRHVAQASIRYPTNGTQWREGWPKFSSADAEESFFLIERLLCALESEFDSKKRTRSQRQKIERQSA